MIAAAVGGGLIDTDRHHQRRRIRWHQTSTATRGRSSKGNLVTDYVTPPPQLSRDDLAHLTPAEISRALELGQLRALLNRRPTRPPASTRTDADRAGLAAMTPPRSPPPTKPDNPRPPSPSKEIR